MAKHRLADLIDVEKVQGLLDSLYEAYSFPSAIIDNEGNIITASGWQDVCTKFHRADPVAEKLCRKSDQYVVDHLRDARPWVRYQCPHGLTDTATPIIIDGEHLGNVFTGQFFLEPPDLEHFRRQAKKYGFAEDAYLAAVRRAPVLSGEQFERILGIVHRFTILLAEMGLQRRDDIARRDELLGQKAMLDAIVNASPSLIYVYDLVEKKNVYANRETLEFLGYERARMDAAAGALMEMISHPDDLSAIDAHHAGLAAARDGEVRELEYRLRASNGIWHWLRSRDVVFRRDAAGRPCQILGMAEDVTMRREMVAALQASEQKNRELLADSDRSRRALLGILEDQQEVERALRASEEQFRSLFEQASQGIFIIDNKGRIVDVNAAMAAMHGYTREEMLCLGLAELDTPAAAAHVAERMRRIDAGEVLYFETEHYHKDGRVFPLEVSANIISYRGNRYIIAFHRDITEQKKAERELTSVKTRADQSEKLAALGRLAAGTAHELNQPLNAIKNFCQALLIMQETGRPPSPERVKENLTMAVQQVDRMAELIRSMRLFARQEKQENIETLDLNELIGEPFKLLGTQLRAHTISHEIRPADKPLLVMGNRNRLLQVLINLVTNARDAIQQLPGADGGETAGTIIVLCRRDDAANTAVLEVHDTGIGIKPEDVEHVFEPFFTAKDRTDSIGLGLAISYEIVHAHGGELRVESVFGHGATFSVVLPLAGRPAAGGTAAQGD